MPGQITTKQRRNRVFKSLHKPLIYLGVEPGESLADAVVREVREETGICVRSEFLTSPTWRGDVIYTYRAARRLQHEVIFLIRLEEVSPPIATTQRIGFEQEDYFDSRRWAIEQVAASRAQFYPRSLPLLIQRFAKGEQIVEGLETWD